MTVWMPKKKPLYAPMLATFGGGSIRGFKGGGGVPEIPYNYTQTSVGSHSFSGYSGSHRITLIGGGGGTGAVSGYMSGFGGRGGLVIFDIDLDAATTYTAFVGEYGGFGSSNVGAGGQSGPNGGNSGGNGGTGQGGTFQGGAGGGATTLAIGSTILAVAAGGGGAGGGDQTSNNNIQIGDLDDGINFNNMGAAFGGDADDDGESGQANSDTEAYNVFGGGRGTVNAGGVVLNANNVSYTLTTINGYSNTSNTHGGDGSNGNAGAYFSGGNGGSANGPNAGGAGGGGSGYYGGAGGKGGQSGRTPSYAGAGGGGANYLAASVTQVQKRFHNGYLGNYGLGGGWDNQANTASDINTVTSPNSNNTTAAPRNGISGYFKIQPNF